MTTDEHNRVIAEHEAKSARVVVVYLAIGIIGFVMFCGGMAWAAWLAG